MLKCEITSVRIEKSFQKRAVSANVARQNMACRMILRRQYEERCSQGAVVKGA